MNRLLLLVTVLMFHYSGFCQKGRTLTVKDNGHIVTLRQGAVFTLSLRDPGDGGYAFQAPRYDSAVIRLLSSKHQSPKERMPGNFGAGVWKFKVLKGGATTGLEILIQRPWLEGKEKPVTDFSVTLKTK